MEILNNKLKVQQIGKYRFLILNENRMDIESKLNHSKRLLLEGLVSYFDTEIFSRMYYMYDVTGYVTLEQYLKQELTKQQALTLIMSLSSTLALSSQHEVAFNQILYDDNLILVNPSTGKASYIYYPFNQGAIAYTAVVDHIRGVIGKLITEEVENEQYVIKLLNCCNQLDFSFSSLTELCNELLTQLPTKKKNIIEGLKASVSFGKKHKEDSAVGIEDTSALASSTLAKRPMISEAFGTGIEDSKFSRSGRVKTEDAASIIGNPTVKGLYLENMEDKTRIMISRNIFRLGSDEGLSDYVLAESCVGKRHATIIQKSGKYYIIDNYSQEGTRVNEAPIVTGTEFLLNDGDKIAIGTTSWRFCVIGY